MYNVPSTNIHTHRRKKAQRNLKILTIVHKAILEANAFGGRFNVICDLVPSPNMRNPETATLPYINMDKIKLHKDK